jgi:lipopolysaccharide biosynthesis regulator YciM
VFGRRRREREAQAGGRAWRRSLRAAVEEDWAAAETWLERIVEADSEDLDAYHALALLYRRQGAVGRAIRMHQNLLLRPDLPSDAKADALLELARDFDHGGFAQRAIAAYEEALAGRSRSVEALERLIRLLHAERQYERALALVRRLRRRERPTADRLEVEILLAQAQARMDSGDAAAARHSLKRCLRRDRACGAAWVALAELEAERGKTGRALDGWKRAAAADPTLAPALFPRIAATFAAQGKPEQYERYLRGWLEEHPGDPVASIALARALAGRGDSTAAIEELSRAIEASPEDTGLRAELGRQLLASGQEAEALKAYGELIPVLERSSLEAVEEAAS